MSDKLYDREYVQLIADTAKQQGRQEMKAEIVKWLQEKSDAELLLDRHLFYKYILEQINTEF